jgi:hypothetical protein
MLSTSLSDRCFTLSASTLTTTFRCLLPAYLTIVHKYKYQWQRCQLAQEYEYQSTHVDVRSSHLLSY